MLIMRNYLVDTDLPFPATVKDKPYSAEFERIIFEGFGGEPTGKYIFRGSVQRASSGRTRKEFDMLGPDGTNLHLIVIQDTSNRVVHLLHPESNSTASIPLTEFMELNSGFAVAGHDEKLGERLIESVSCKGYRGSRGSNRITTLWVSEDLGEALIEENMVDGQTEDSLRIFNINLTEPDPSLFVTLADGHNDPIP